MKRTAANFFSGCLLKGLPISKWRERCDRGKVVMKNDATSERKWWIVEIIVIILVTIRVAVVMEYSLSSPNSQDYKTTVIDSTEQVRIVNGDNE